MTRFLAVIRRFFWAGTISLMVCLIAFRTSFSTLFNLAKNPNSIQSIFAIYFLVSPIFFLLFTIFSVIHIRKNGQFASVHQTQSPMTTFFRCWGHDIVAPFKNLGNFFRAVFGKNVTEKGVFVRRFIGMIVLIVVCVIGIAVFQ